MKLQQIRITNFKGIRDFVLDAGGESVSIFGENGIGKTTIADAFFFALFGKDSRGQADFDIKTLNAAGEPIHNLEHAVEVTLDDVTFGRTYKEVYQQKRGSVTKEFTGHTTDYAVNGVPVDKRAYDNEVQALCPEGKFRLLTDPTNFASLKWQDRRRMLMDAFAANVTDEFVIKWSPSLAALPSILGRHSVDEYRRIADAKRKAINDQLKTIPARIDELNRTLNAPIPSERGTDLVHARLQLGKAQQDRAEYLAGAGGARITTEIAKAEEAVERYTMARRREYEQAVDAKSATRRAKTNELSEARQSVASLQRAYETERVEHARLSEQLVTLRADHRTLKAEEFGGATVCPTCEQSLPESRIESARASWNEKHARALDASMQRGKALSAQVEALGQRMQDLSDQTIDAQAKVERLEAELSRIPAVPDFQVDTTAVDYQALVAKLDRLRNDQGKADSGDNSELAAIDARIAEFEGTIAAAEQAAHARATRQSTETRIKELSAEEATLMAEHEQLVQNTMLLDEFVRAKVSLLTEQINGNFSMARFRLFEEQINGGLAECCEITYNGVPWGSLNTAARVNVGLDIIDTLASVMKADPMPIIIDGAESVTEIRPTAGQQIRLIVSAGDKTLRVAKGNKLAPISGAVDAEERELVTSGGGLF